MKRILALALPALLSAAACSSTVNNEPGVTPTGVQPAERSSMTSKTGAGDTAASRTGSDSNGWTGAQPSTTNAGTASTMGNSGASNTGTGSNGSGSNGATGTSTGPAPAPAAAANTTSPAPSRPDADNTRVNERDRNSAALTPGDQGGSEADRKTTQQIRKSVMGDSSLSFTAKNVKIITVNGRVTLRGAVKTDQERASIEAAAKKIAGDGQVDNQIEVKK